jgi:hypothetical protein
VPEQGDAAPTAGQHGFAQGAPDAELATGGGSDDHRDILPVTGAPGQRGVGERSAQGAAVEAFMLREAPQLLIARGVVARSVRAAGQVCKTERTLAEDQDHEQGKGGRLLREQRRPEGFDDGGDRAIPWPVSGLLTRLSASTPSVCHGWPLTPLLVLFERNIAFQSAKCLVYNG